MTELHLVVGVAVLALNVVVGLWGVGRRGCSGARRCRSGTCCARRRSRWSCRCCSGAILLIAGHEPKDAIHYMYGIGAAAREPVRGGHARRAPPSGRCPRASSSRGLPAGEQRAIALRIVRREMLIMSLAALLVAAFALRAAQVSGAIF